MKTYSLAVRLELNISHTGFEMIRALPRSRLVWDYRLGEVTQLSEVVGLAISVI